MARNAGQCEYVKPDGERCRARAMAGSPLCFFHAPERAAQRAEANRAGGKARSKPATVLPPETPDLPLRSIPDVGAYLAVTLNQTRKGELDARIANSLFYGASVLLRAHADGELALQVEALRAELNEVRGHVRGDVAEGSRADAGGTAAAAANGQSH